MSVPSFEAVKGVYQNLWDTLVPTSSRMPELEKIAQRALDHKPAYQAVAQTVWGTPDYWYVVALIDQMEGGGGANTYLGNGQSLSRVTTEVPAGRGPFDNFHDGAADALRYDGLDKIHDWSAASVGYHLEGYNGWGYLSKPIVSPYIASWSNRYTSGKYVADHVYDANAVSQQPGALTILKVLATLDKTINLTAKDKPVVTDTPVVVAVSNPGVATLMQELDKVTHVLQGLVSYIPMLAGIPFIGAQVAPLLPFVPVAQAILAALDKIEHANGDLPTIIAAGQELFPHITALIEKLEESSAMTPDNWVELFTAFSSLVAAVLSIMNRNHLSKQDDHLALLKSTVDTVHASTNSMKDELVAAVKSEATAAGIATGKAQQKADNQRNR